MVYESIPVIFFFAFDIIKKWSWLSALLSLIVLLLINEICCNVFVGNAFMRSERFMNHQSSTNQKNDDFCVGNAFMHSTSATFLSGYIEWIIVGKKLEPVSIQRTMDIHQRFGTDKSVPYAKHNIFRFHNHWGLATRAECINAFPTKIQ